jgi:hypothetical protein
MKYSFIILGLVLISTCTSSFLKKTENTAACRTSYYYFLNTYSSLPYPYYSTPMVTTIDTPVTYTLSDPVVSSVTYPSPFFSYTPYVYYSYLWRKAGVSEEVKLSVIHDHDLKSYDVKGSLFHRDETNKENWYTHGKVDDKVKEALKSCQQIHTENKTKKFKNVEDKASKTLPESLIPKNASFSRSPQLKVYPNRKPVEMKAEVKPVELAKPVEKKAEVKPVEAIKSVEKKVEVKPVEDAKPVEKKVEEVKPVEKKAEVKPVEAAKPVERKAEAEKKVEDKKAEVKPEVKAEVKAEVNKPVEAKK